MRTPGGAERLTRTRTHEDRLQDAEARLDSLELAEDPEPQGQRLTLELAAQRDRLNRQDLHMRALETVVVTVIPRRVQGLEDRLKRVEWVLPPA